MNLGVATLSLYLRRFPFESGRWRFIPYGLRKCEQNCRTPTPRTVRTRHGFRMQVDVSEWLGRHVFVTGQYEAATANVFCACLNPGDTFLDIGANAGFFSLLAAQQVGPTGNVLSFEPLPKANQALRHNIAVNSFDNVQVFDVALSSQSGEASFFVGPDSHLGVSSLRSFDGASEQVVVRTARADELLEHEQVNVLKIDVEGAELLVLAGMLEMLRRCSPDMIIEISPEYLAGLGASVAEIDAVLTNLQYQRYAVEHRGLRPLNLLTDYPSTQFNAFLTKRSSLPAGLEVITAK